MKNGDPIGLLIINGKVLSETIYNRGKLIIIDSEQRDKPSSCFISSQLFSFKLKQGREIGGFNRESQGSELILYTDEFLGKTHNHKDFFKINDYYLRTFSNVGLDDSDFKVLWNCDDLFSKNIDKKRISVLEAGPILVKDGMISIMFEQENFKRDFIYNRAQRSGIGLSKDMVSIVVSQGRETNNIGLDLVDFAMFFLNRLDCIDALNLDGGSSSELIYKGRIVYPKKEIRHISNGIFIVKRSE